MLKIIALLLATVAIAGCVGQYQNSQLPEEIYAPIPESNITELGIPLPAPNITINTPVELNITSPVLLSNPVMEMPVRYYIDPIDWRWAIFYPKMINDTISGLKKWETATNGTVSFREVPNPTEANLIIKFRGHIDVLEGGYLVAGEGGPTDYETVRGFTIIKKSELSIVPDKKENCQTTEIVAHEMGHALGFDHDNIWESFLGWGLSKDCGFKTVPKNLTNDIDRLYRYWKENYTAVVVQPIRENVATNPHKPSAPAIKLIYSTDERDSTILLYDSTHKLTSRFVLATDLRENQTYQAKMSNSYYKQELFNVVVLGSAEYSKLLKGQYVSYINGTYKTGVNSADIIFGAPRTDTYYLIVSINGILIGQKNHYSTIYLNLEVHTS